MAIITDDAQRQVAPRNDVLPQARSGRFTPKTTLVLPGRVVLAACDRWLMRNSIILLRMSMGAVIFGFGFLKYFPGVSPAQGLVMTTTDLLTFGLIPHGVALILTATMECVIGLSLITTLWLRATIYLLALWLVGILSPTVLLFGRLFGGPDHAPTLEGQYVLKDIILVTASLVIASTLRATKNDRTPAKTAAGSM